MQSCNPSFLIVALQMKPEGVVLMCKTQHLLKTHKAYCFIENSRPNQVAVAASATVARSATARARFNRSEA